MSAVGVGLGASADEVGADLGAFTFSPPVLEGLAKSSANAGLARVVARSSPNPKTCRVEGIHNSRCYQAQADTSSLIA